MGDKNPNAEYWVLGAQFLHNYYTIYDFQKHQIGLVESMTSLIGKGGAGGPSKTLVGSGPRPDSDEAAAGEASGAEGKKTANIGSAPHSKSKKKVATEEQEE